MMNDEVGTMDDEGQATSYSGLQLRTTPLRERPGQYRLLQPGGCCRVESRPLPQAVLT
jgi:hypothetical protein